MFLKSRKKLEHRRMARRVYGFRHEGLAVKGLEVGGSRE